MERTTSKRPGHDCIYAECTLTDPPCKQPPDLSRPNQEGPGNNHGIHCEEWHYVLTANDKSKALRLTVYTDIFPDTVPDDHSKRCGLSLDRHAR
ncbi:hypothetical protein LCGC14_1799800 [marine sediment metagenome]|uniref:Uncharacterized protein n=1 Tax=marine sediment metagenome TaxID=412755 RepID=A0A0F9JPL2_9ZZZZ